MGWSSGDERTLQSIMRQDERTVGVFQTPWPRQNRTAALNATCFVSRCDKKKTGDFAMECRNGRSCLRMNDLSANSSPGKCSRHPGAIKPMIPQ
jgi:hypothetical protein